VITQVEWDLMRLGGYLNPGIAALPGGGGRLEEEREATRRAAQDEVLVAEMTHSIGRMYPGKSRLTRLGWNGTVAKKHRRIRHFCCAVPCLRWNC